VLAPAYGYASVLAGEGDRHWLSLKLGDCASCGRTHLIAVDELTLIEHARGHQVREARPFIPFHEVSERDMGAIRARPAAGPR
jgi:hypothetical protein